MTLGDIIRMEEVIKKLIAERDQTKAEGAAEERAKIVAWLREIEEYPFIDERANRIEAKEHLK
jgi:hypothetical protein